MASNIGATNISVAADPSGNGNTIITFTRSDNSQQVQLSVPIVYEGGTTTSEIAAAEQAVQTYLHNANEQADEVAGLAALNAAASGQTVTETTV